MFYKELLCNATVLLLCSKNLEILQGINHFKALYIVGRGALTLLPFYEDAPILPNPPFSNFVWSLTCNLVFCWYSDLISHTHTYTHTHTHTHTWVIKLTHPNKCIFTSPVMCSQQLSLLHKWIIHGYQKFTFHSVLISKSYALVKVMSVD